MKKLILSLFLFCSIFAFSQGTIPIPQIIGLPAALASKVDKVTGKSLVADTSIVKLTGIQASAQVNKLEGIQKNGVDLAITGKKVNITVPTTATEIGAQPAGTYATGTGTAYNSNNGDETLTSIKTKLGAATSVSDGYLKYQDYVKFDGKLSSEVDGNVTNELQTISTTGAAGNITLSNSGGTLNLNVNDADASPTNEIQDLSLSGNILTLSSDAPVDISQATAVQANTAKVSNATHTGDVTGSTALTLATVNASIGTYNNVTINAKGLATAGSNVSYEPSFSKNTAFNKNFGTTTGTVLEGRTFGTAAGSAVGDFQPAITGLTTNSLVKWNGSSMVNSLISDDGSSPTIIKSSGDAVFSFKSGANTCSFGSDVTAGFIVDNGLLMWYGQGGVNNFYRECKVIPTTPSTSPTNGALVVGGGIGADHVRANNFYGNGSNLTGIQLPITLTTNGTSGAATFSGNVLNVPNYGSGAISGEYTPIANGLTNISAVSILYARYVKVGNIYTVSITGTATTTATSPCTFELTTPDASTVGSQNALVVTAIRNTSPPTSATAYSMSGSAGHVTVAIIPGTTGNVTFSISGQVHN